MVFSAVFCIQYPKNFRPSAETRGTLILILKYYLRKLPPRKNLGHLGGLSYEGRFLNMNTRLREAPLLSEVLHLKCSKNMYFRKEIGGSRIELPTGTDTSDSLIDYIDFSGSLDYLV